MFLIKLLLILPAGHLYNELGNLEDWWTMKSNSAYEQLSQCFVEQYNNYTLYGKHVSIIIIITIESVFVFNNVIQLLMAYAHNRTGLIWYVTLKMLCVQVNGTLTLAENMADVGGLQLAQQVYEKYLQTNGGWEADAHLPGVNMTEQQVFYLSYAQVGASVFDFFILEWIKWPLFNASYYI